MATFGQEAVGGTEVSTVSTVAYRSLFTCPVAGRLDTISIYIKGGLNNTTACVGIYDGLVLLGHVDHAIVAGEAAAWHDLDFSGLAIDLLNQVYGLGFKSITNGFKVYRAVGDANQTETDTVLVAGDHLPDPFAHDTHENTKYSIHADYTPSSGQQTKTLIEEYDY